MLGYSIMILAVSVLFAVLSVLIYRGNTSLIHSYHQEKVTDQKGYGRAFGKALSPIAIGAFVSGAIPIFDGSEAAATVSLGALTAGIVLALVLIIMVQKKYNGGLF